MENNRHCKCCGRSFVPHLAVPFQEYCGDPACQKARKMNWRRGKLANDKDYKDYQKDSQKKWQSKNKDYWRNYRKRNPQYTRQNRIKQKERNRKRRFPVIAKSDELTLGRTIVSGDYMLTPVCNKKVAKSDELIVRLNLISRVATNNQPAAP